MKIPDEAYFPYCTLPDCPITNERVELLKNGQITVIKPHSHILPRQQEIIDNTSKYLYTQGGVGSAKTVAFAAKVVKLCMEIPKNKGIVGRRNFKELFKTAWLDVKECIKRLVEQGYIEESYYKKSMFTDKKQGDHTTITFPNESIIYALQTKNIFEGLGASYGFFWIDDAMESSKEIFVGNSTNMGLISRLRLPHVMYHREEDNDGNVKVVSRLQGLVSSNPPPINSWLHEIFGRSQGIHKIGDDDVKVMIVQTTDNIFLGTEYVKSLVAMNAKAGGSQNTIKRIIFGESIPAYDGIPVYPQFQHERHITEQAPDFSLPLIVHWDFGIRHPAALCSQIIKCEAEQTHFITFSEVVDEFNLTIYKMYEKVKKHLDDRYKEIRQITHCGDQSGYRRSSSNKDGRSDARILVQEFNLSFKRRYLDLLESIKYMRRLLQPKQKCECGQERVLIHKNCVGLIGALEGGYHFSSRNGVVSEKPIKDGYFDDIADAWRYGPENFFRRGYVLGYDDRLEIEDDDQPRQRLRYEKPWDWMSITDKDFSKLVLPH